MKKSLIVLFSVLILMSVSCKDLNQNTPIQITYNPEMQFHPKWSHDGEILSYVSYENGKPEIIFSEIKNSNS